MIFVNPIVAPIFCKNAPDVIIRSDYEHTITVTVSCGDDSWDFDLQPSLSSDGDGYRAVIRMKELLQSVVRVPSVSVSQSEPLPIVTIVADNGEEEVITMSFVAAYGGAAGRSPREVLGQWLSWKDQVSKTYSWARETLVFFAGLNLTSWASGFYVVSAKVFFKDGTSEDVEIETGNLQETDQYISVAAGLSDISSLISSTGVITAYDVRFSLSGTTATGLSQSIDGYPQRFIVSRNDIRAREFIFRNSFGLEDRVFASGTEDLQLEGDTFSFINNGIEQELYNDAKEQREVRSGYISTPRGIALWIDFLKADNRFLFDSVNRLREIVVDSFDTDITENSIGSVSFVYHLSEQSAGRFFNPGDRVLSDYMPPTAIGALFVGNTPVPEEEIPAEDLFF